MKRLSTVLLLGLFGYAAYLHWLILNAPGAPAQEPASLVNARLGGSSGGERLMLPPGEPPEVVERTVVSNPGLDPDELLAVNDIAGREALTSRNDQGIRNIGTHVDVDSLEARHSTSSGEVIDIGEYRLPPPPPVSE